MQLGSIDFYRSRRENYPKMSSSSSDSDGGERIKNLQMFLIKSKVDQEEANENYAYKQKLGDLIFDANFEGGNLGCVEQIDLYEYDLMIRPDVANPRHRLWFNFTISNQHPNQCVILTFVNLSEDFRLLHEGLTPVARSKLNPRWIRLHEDQVFYYRSSSHGDRYVLSIAFRFSNHDDEHQFALFYPYTYTNLTNFVSRWEVELKRASQGSQYSSNQPQYRRSPVSPSDCFRSGSCSPSALGRRLTPKEQQCHGEDVDFDAKILLKTILHKSLYSISIRGVHSDSSRPISIILCRPCGNIDSATSYVCQGLIDYLLSEQPLSRASRQCMDVLVFPMMDPDSICTGNSRTDIMGQAKVSMKMLESSKGIYANLAAISDILERLCLNSEHRVVIIEMNVNVNLIGSKIIGTHYEDGLRMERHLSFPRLMARFADDFYMENCTFSKKESSSNFMFNFSEVTSVDQYRMEVSPFAFYKRSLLERSYEEYNQLKYLALGKAMVYALFELLRPKDKVLLGSVTSILDSFHPKSNDVDNLILNSEDNLVKD